ncbi:MULTISPECIES: UbiA family prenyltransferase [Acidobacteriaceae]|uniref:UbiA family prenyltransferase n=1 Tax=Acidobacteriaceae TaxID=204434 RepID=UPI00131B5784|nr:MULTISPECIES: UbiA family prenyltransferase [Acidobacteriaceae]MDW5265683.1 UbiA family prenyltransferase [Edaphobacter sp.]
MASRAHESAVVAAPRTDLALPIPFGVRLRAHIAIMRLDHSIKNIFLLPGIVVALSLLHPKLSQLGQIRLMPIVVGVVAVTLIACSNYVLNELLDAPYDRLHPHKCNRPAALGLIDPSAAYAQWLAMMVVGMTLASWIGLRFAVAAGALWIMGCIYNIRPLRTKDVAYLDVLTESLNNPLRMLLGWYMVTQVIIPPTSMLCAYWMLGCYFMGLKRFSEFREIGSHQGACAYRKSFENYSERSLLGSVVFYASMAMMMFGIFVVRYRIELILAFPFIALLMAMYFDLSFKKNSAVQHPEKLYREPSLMAIALATCIIMIVLLNIHLPLVGQIFTPTKW